MQSILMDNNMMENTSMALGKEKVNTYMQMETSTRVILKIIGNMVLVSLHTKIKESIMGSGKMD